MLIVTQVPVWSADLSAVDVPALVARLGVPALVVPNAIGITSPDKRETIISIKSLFMKDNKLQRFEINSNYVVSGTQKFSKISMRCTYL